MPWPGTIRLQLGVPTLGTLVLVLVVLNVGSTAPMERAARACEDVHPVARQRGVQRLVYGRRDEGDEGESR